jgi:aminopeptidase N
MTITDAPSAPVRKFRKDYQAPEFAIDKVDLVFDLGASHTTVRAKLTMRRLSAQGAVLELNGEELETVSIKVDGQELAADRYTKTDETLTIEGLPESFVLDTEVRLEPAKNTSLSGLYHSSGNFCTQCEAEGFRRITWFMDRPDVMSVYSTTILGDSTRLPVMLSNGNRVHEEMLEDGRRSVRWEDPFPKPSYLFALVAGDLRSHAGTFNTMSGREVALEIWVEPRNIEACEFALQSLKNAMKWDEETFGLEYDLDLYMIVAVDDFNMGAMENKGLNVFNSKYVLARPETATDEEYEGVEGVIGHEYFHNWTGNRVTCRDWFQLTLKEGLTVYRDQEFSAKMTSKPVKRIDDVRALRARQFAEDAGPMSHPIRPESYVAMDNFYTATVYEKGGQVIRMYETLLGKGGFRKGMDLYFERHDGQAVTCDDFRAAMSDANGRDLAQFERWYLQNGTPNLAMRGTWNDGAYTVELTQSAPSNHEGDYVPMLIPVRVGLMGPDGADLPMAASAGEANAPTERVLELTELSQSWTFHDLAAEPQASVLRDFSAPVILDQKRDRQELAFALANDKDAFNRWEAGQDLFGGAILELAADAAAGHELTLDPAVIEAFRAVLNDDTLDGSIRSMMLITPGEMSLSQKMDVIDPDALFVARRFVRNAIATALVSELCDVHAAHLPSGPYTSTKAEIDRRRMANLCLAYLCSADEVAGAKLAKDQFDAADNMTDSEAALGCLVELDSPLGTEALAAFRSRWENDPLVMDKWFRLQASCRREGSVQRVKDLLADDAFNISNPNRVRSVLHVFAAVNHTGFHDKSGEGYALIADNLIELDKLNPQVAARLAGSFNSWKRYDEPRQKLMRAQLERITKVEGLSSNTGEIVGRALAN